MSSNSSWWWGSASGGATAEFERVLESCTSSNLPSSTPPPITDSLTLSDLIRSSAVTANYALKSLLKRLNHSNPNVQLLAIAVIDICVKNGGDGFLREVGSFQFSEDCAQIIRNPTSNRDVQEKLRREFQNWALAFEAVPFLSSSELVTNYRKLKSSGVEFPPKDPSATAAMVDSMSAPEWRDSDVCERCRTAFSFTNRKHHCRNCGGVFDGQCSGKKRSLPHFGVTELVRICDGCYRSLSGGISSTSKPGISSGRRNSFSGESLQSPPLKGSASQSSHQRSATFHAAGFGRNSNRHSQPVSLGNHRSVGAFTSQEDADLERAIALSLQDARSSQKASHKIHSSAISTPQPSSILGAPSKPSIGAISDENDPDLAAAIAASLRDVTQPSAPMPISPSESTRKQPSILALQPDPGSESINVLLNFSADVEAASRLGQLHPSNLDLRNRYVNVEQGLPHFNRAIESTERKAQHLKDMNDKLSEAVRMYDRLLSEQVMYRSQSALHSNPNPAASSNFNLPASYNSSYPSQPSDSNQNGLSSHAYPQQAQTVPESSLHLNRNQQYSVPPSDPTLSSRYLPMSRNAPLNNLIGQTIDGHSNAHALPGPSPSQVPHEYQPSQAQAPLSHNSINQAAPVYRADQWIDTKIQQETHQVASSMPHGAQFFGAMVPQPTNFSKDLPTTISQVQSPAPIISVPSQQANWTHPSLHTGAITSHHGQVSSELPANMATSQVFDSIIGTALAKTEGFSNINTSAPQKNVWSNPTSQLSTQELHLQLASTTLSPDPMPAVTNPGPTPESHNTSQFYSPKVALSYSGEPILQSNTDLEQHRLGHGPAEGLTHDGTQVKFVGEQHVRALEPQLGSESQIADANGIEGPSSFEQMFPSAPKALPELQSVGAVGTTTALSSSNTLPNFPSVPNGQSGWMNQSGRLWESSGHERSGRQEEVAPLIEL